VTKKHAIFSKNHRINKTVNSLIKQCFPLERFSAFPIFRLVSSGFAQIVVGIFPCPPVKVPIFSSQQ